MSSATTLAASMRARAAGIYRAPGPRVRWHGGCYLSTKMERQPATTSTKSRRGVDARFYVDDAWLALRSEDPIEPDIPIVDAHHHLWDRSGAYLVPELLADLRCGHNLRGTVYVEAGSMYRADGDPALASLGEVEYANGVGAAFASGYYGDVRACAGIVGKVDLTLGAAAEELLRASMSRAPDRFRGVRHMAAWDDSPHVSRLLRPPPSALMEDRRFREGFGKLASLGLSFDSYCYHPQLPELIGLIDAFPDTSVIVDHVGGRIGEGPYAGRQEEVFRDWKASIQALARRDNVFIKLGGLNSRLTGFTFIDREVPPSSQDLAQAWKPYVDTCIEAFGAERAMFESNFPPDKTGCSATVLWNAFKRIVADHSGAEKAALFAGTAIRAYRLPEALGKTSKNEGAG